MKSELELFVRLVNSFKKLNIAIKISVIYIFEVLDLLLSLNLTAKIFSCTTIVKLKTISFLFLFLFLKAERSKDYRIIDLIKKSLNHFSKDRISLGEHKKEENIIFFC